MNILSVPEFAAVLGDCGNHLVNASESNYRCTYELTYTKIRLTMNLKFVLTGISSKLHLKPLCFAIKRRLSGFSMIFTSFVFFKYSSLLSFLLSTFNFTNDTANWPHCSTGSQLKQTWTPSHCFFRWCNLYLWFIFLANFIWIISGFDIDLVSLLLLVQLYSGWIF